ncbi:nucleotidyltransferase [Candidatus Roizmanbacteria bacterium CG_4_9_14_0_8_um_filter_34_12]|uniref:Nucleotidyltransferase n=6 Tax=Candidatus Roizmaniibacteriota TaxID=1752723 RepID=A0A2M7BXY9_9BACT|nr:MAG: nucleotidyltransferase [Candidatus Roizmanbacteria bacterium CG22_combo_CG10-13_8_21_14_all_33_16]PIV11441.1 MAG: nucleotidyltransferase [Candidatus Roizmanbacteria bacterium CG03_land_8_20_14_0_80_35_26]PIX73787.1 MAG: nucleotidyltransferase [Candidatus Roizmanbacteria bacterium CG_4_10_14_3_um_filter_33_21]PIY71011.1 MAG: nucleotidyltransferase [Candidatus Roizmanbacteria bacterium CG_4_10_14_0_8_um_filter_35_28]PJB87618.1 MAG: nucleotidyltransferase [Candidatus Roizmanbacteria bacter
MINKIILKKQGILNEIENYIKVLIKNKINPEKIILYGSFAKEKAHQYSDIDIAVISDQFGKDEIEELMELERLTIDVSDRIEAIPLTNDNLKLKYHSLIGEIKKYGKIVYSSD